MISVQHVEPLTEVPEFKPASILDCGCTVGHNTLPWAETFPEAQVTAIDVAAPVLRYAHARAESMDYRFISSNGCR